MTERACGYCQTINIIKVLLQYSIAGKGENERVVQEVLKEITESIATASVRRELRRGGYCGEEGIRGGGGGMPYNLHRFLHRNQPRIRKGRRFHLVSG